MNMLITLKSRLFGLLGLLALSACALTAPEEAALCDTGKAAEAVAPIVAIAGPVGDDLAMGLDLAAALDKTACTPTK
jgi:hypothetical protein